MMNLTYPSLTKPKRSKKPEIPSFKKIFKQTENADPPMGLIQGIKPGSIQEWRVAVALSRLKLRFIYQYPVFGGRRIRGGQVIDFWIFTAPLPTPCYVQGTYWHRRSKELEDRLKQDKVQQRYKGQVGENLLLPEEKLTSVQAAFDLIKDKLL
jgi:hypothetical protein